MRVIKIILTDIAGVLLIILAGLTGWLPGPGGIPLFLAGLGLLAINHDWARRLLRNVKTHGLNLANKFFRDHPVLVVVYDIIAGLLVAGGVLLILHIHGFWKTSAVMVIFVGLGLFLGNRKRLQRIVRYFKKENRE